MEEGEKLRAILADGGNYDFTGSEEGPLIDLVLAGAESGQGQVDLVGALHGPASLPPPARPVSTGRARDAARLVPVRTADGRKTEA